jgi:hypothetical protein
MELQPVNEADSHGSLHTSPHPVQDSPMICPVIIPLDVQLKIAESLLDVDVVPVSERQATFARLLLVSRTFLQFGLRQLYGHATFEAYADSLARLQLMRYDTLY